MRLPRRHRPSSPPSASLLKLRGRGEEDGVGVEGWGRKAANRLHFWTRCCSAKVHPLGRVESAQGSEKKWASSQVWCRLCVAAVCLTTSFLETCPSAPSEIHPCCSTGPLPNLCGPPCPASTLLPPSSFSPLLQPPCPDSISAGRILQVTPTSYKHLRWASVSHPMQQTGSR